MPWLLVSAFAVRYLFRLWRSATICGAGLRYFFWLRRFGGSDTISGFGGPLFVCGFGGPLLLLLFVAATFKDFPVDKRILKKWLSGGPLGGVDPSEKKHIKCLYL